MPIPTSSPAPAAPIELAAPQPTPPPPDTTPPRILILTALEPVYAAAPFIQGEAHDAKGVARVDYSTDDGQNWLPAAVTPRPGAPDITDFTFTPELRDDGNYAARVRAADAAGNETISEPLIIVIDHLPPRLGTVFFTQGPQVITPSSTGIMLLTAGVETKLTAAAIGGPITLDVYFTLLAQGAATSREAPLRVSLAKNAETGLWSAPVTLTQAGAYQATIHLLDGAGNRTTTPLTPVAVQEPGQVAGEEGPIAGATITVWQKLGAGRQFARWDAAPFGEANPVTTGADGRFYFMVPPGTYYMTAAAPGYQPMTSALFTLTEGRPLITTISLTRGAALRPWSRWWPSLRSTVLTFREEGAVAAPPGDLPHRLVGHELPFFAIPQGEATAFSTDTKGKPAVVTLLTTWAPGAGEQLRALDELAADPALNVLAIMNQESTAKVNLWRRRGHYRIPLLADRTSEAVTAIGLQHVPTHLIVNRRGIIERVHVGLLTAAQLHAMVSGGER